MKRITRHVLHALILCMCCASYSSAQQMDTGTIFREPVMLDSYVVSSGFDVAAFIRRVRADTTFYKAFKNMRFVSYSADNRMEVFNRRHAVVASWYSRTKQQRDRRCRVTRVLEEKTTGDFYKWNGDYNYYTSELFAYLFFSKEPVCDESDIVAGTLDAQPGGKLQKSSYQMKQLIFNPGGRVAGIPFMAARESIFEPGEAGKYEFSVKMDKTAGADCYVFRIVPKKGYERKTLYNELTTWFRKSDYSIVARNYSLSYSTLVYDFDVTMQVRTQERNGKLYPVHIGYDGDWHIFTKKRERVHFTIDITY